MTTSFGKCNCWDYTGCGFEQGGDNVDKEGVCPAVSDNSVQGVNNGTAAGRFCWNVEGTFCHKWDNEKYANCFDCPFFAQVRREEGSRLIISRAGLIK